MRKKGKHMKEKNKHIIVLNIVILCLVMLLLWQKSYAKYTSEIKQDPFNVEFIAGEIKLSLIDNNDEFIIVPGMTIEKETKVTIEALSEACYLFVKLDKLNNFDNYIEYEIAEEWTKLEGNTDIYYCELPKITTDTEINVFKNNQIIVKETVTKQDLEEINENKPTINVTAYAVQKTSEIITAADAWNLIYQ